MSGRSALRGDLARWRFTYAYWDECDRCGRRWYL